MKYDAHAIEERWKAFWATENVFSFNASSKAPLYVVDTPPPYVSADHLHAGHIMSYAQAEFIVRYKRMRGFNVYYPMGFDDNGLPTERFVEKKYAVDKSKISRPEFVKLCLKETQKGAETYRKLWQDLGISVDWNHTYSTINEHSQRTAQTSFIDLYKKGHLYRAEKPVMWCTHCQTTLAQADLEDMKRETDFVHIEVPVEGGGALVFATTRPEMYPSCVGISVHPDDERYKRYIGKVITMPLTNKKLLLTTDERIDPNFGTGVVYYCSSGDAQFLDWETRHPIADADKTYILGADGRMNDGAGKYKGLTITEARRQITADLTKLGVVKKVEKIEQIVNVHERCDTPIEYITSKQWFIKIADQKDKWLELGRQIKWYPESRRNDYETWVNGLVWDWCVSRQRYYGVPIPVWYDKKTGEPVFPTAAELPVDPTQYTPKGYKTEDLIPENDVLDTWATSSLSPQIIAGLVKGEETQRRLYPATLRPNAFEIIRTWDFYSIVRGYYENGHLPFCDVMISGHGLAEDGRKLSKRLGNYLPSQELIDKYGADAIRYWATGARLGQNLRFSETEIGMGHKTAVKLYNVARFLSMHIESAGDGELEHADVWIMQELNAAIKGATRAFDEYSYSRARDILDGFFWAKFTDYYIEFIKYRLFGDNLGSKAAAVATLETVFLAILKMYAPLMPFITEQIYQDLYRSDDGAKSIHLSEWPKPVDPTTALDVADFAQAIAAIDEVRKYKAQENVSLGKELDSYILKTKINQTKYGELVRNVGRIKRLVIVDS
ncbi:MAG TPA: valine--tRNA ligase [Candidatus Saccharimonadales bacterium]